MAAVTLLSEMHLNQMQPHAPALEEKCVARLLKKSYKQDKWQEGEESVQTTRFFKKKLGCYLSWCQLIGRLCHCTLERC